MTKRSRSVLAALAGLTVLSACGEEAPNLTIDTTSVPEKAVYFVVDPVKGQPGVRKISGSSFGISRYRLGAVTALVGARLVAGRNTRFLKTAKQKVAETKLCVASKNRAAGCPRFVFEMQIAPAAAKPVKAVKTAKPDRSLMPVQPVLQAERDILDGVQAFRCTITAKQQRCVPFGKPQARLN